MKKILLAIFCLAILSACAQSTAFIGPAVTIGNTGNIMQASLSYGSNVIVKESTGKSPSEHVVSYVEEKKEKKRIREEFANYLESHIEIMRKKLSSKN